MISLASLAMREDPYRAGVAAPVMEPALYRELADSYPLESKAGFETLGGGFGGKLSLSEKFNRGAYLKFIRSSRPWWEFYRYIKSQTFYEETMAALGLDRSGMLSARFEFSSIEAQGGYIKPHTDIPSKIVTLVIPMVHPGLWMPEWGGGTDILRPLDPTTPLRDYQCDRSQFERVWTAEFLPNQAAVFVKSEQSWHSVGPLCGPSGVYRRSLTVNIERLA